MIWELSTQTTTCNASEKLNEILSGLFVILILEILTRIANYLHTKTVTLFITMATI